MFSKSNVFVKMAVFALGFALAEPASAELLQFELTGSRQASFEIDTSTATVNQTSSGDQVIFNNVPGTFNGVVTEQTASTISFGTGGINVMDIAGTLDTTGMTVFTQFATGGPLFSLSGTPPQPIFKTGTFALSGLVSGASSIEISVIPEPSTWAMMLLGFAGLGFAGYRQMQRAKPQAA